MYNDTFGTAHVNIDEIFMCFGFFSKGSGELGDFCNFERLVLTSREM
jgi:hypothetical protein